MYDLDRFSRPIGISFGISYVTYGLTCGCGAKATETYDNEHWCDACLKEYKADNGIVEDGEEEC